MKRPPNHAALAVYTYMLKAQREKGYFTQAEVRRNVNLPANTVVSVVYRFHKSGVIKKIGEEKVGRSYPTPKFVLATNEDITEILSRSHKKLRTFNELKPSKRLHLYIEMESFILLHAISKALVITMSKFVSDAIFTHASFLFTKLPKEVAATIVKEVECLNQKQQMNAFGASTECSSRQI